MVDWSAWLFITWTTMDEIHNFKFKVRYNGKPFSATSQLHVTSPSGGCACKLVLSLTLRRWLHVYTLWHLSRVRQLCVDILSKDTKVSDPWWGSNPLPWDCAQPLSHGTTQFYMDKMTQVQTTLMINDKILNVISWKSTGNIGNPHQNSPIFSNN